MTNPGRTYPYVGVSGVAHIEEHYGIIDWAIGENLLNDDHFIMLGIQATSKTQLKKNGVGIENSRGKDWHPVGDDLRLAAGNDDSSAGDQSGLTRPFVHCFFEDHELEKGIAQVCRRSIAYIQGLQLNKLDFDKVDYGSRFDRLRHLRPDLDLVLQAHDRIMADNTPDELEIHLGRLPVQYVLLDASHGDGKAMDYKRLRPYIDAIYQAQLPIGVVVAGGLSAESIEELFGPLVAEFPKLSCDAEGKLRSGPDHHTHLDLEKVFDYLRAWKELTGAGRDNRFTEVI